MLRGYIFSLFIGLLFLASCSSESNTAINKGYHNMTARFNGYFIAKEDIKAVEAQILDSYQWDYNKILPVFAPFDSTLANSYQEQLDHCIEKASLAIQYHKGSKWEDNAYILVGKSRFYGLDFVNAIETFKYVNTKGKGDDERHEALVDLMRTYIEYDEMNNAIAVADYLDKQELNDTNKCDLHLTKAYFYEKQEEYDRIVKNLTIAEPLIADKKEQSRINFIIGQIQQHLKNDIKAYEHYKRALKHNPPYELSFYTKLNLGQVTQLSKTNDIKKIRKYFVKLLRDRKNEEYKDKIYYEYARFELRNKNLDIGIDHFKSSVKSSVSNDRQKAYSYWSLGQIYYDSLANYPLAKAYYDSTVSVMPQDQEEYEAIVERQQILENFVTQLTIVQTNDSLIHLVNLPKDSMNLVLEEYIKKEEEAENARRKEERRKRKLAAVNNSFVEADPSASLGSNNFDGETWYFYSASLVSKGLSGFKSIWGDRKLEDNWRIASRPPDTIEEDPEEGDVGEENVENKEEEEKEETDPIDEEFTINFDEVLAELPTSAEQQQLLLDEVEEALYQLGNIYYFDLEETPNSIETFESLLDRFSSTEYRLEVMYQLYLIFSEIEDQKKADFYKNKIFSEAPDSIYAKLIKNPNYREDSRFESEQLQLVYKEAYHLYKKGFYDSASFLINTGLAKYTDNDFIDNATLLNSLISGKTEQRHIYEAKLRRFLNDFPESELADYTSGLIKATQDYHLNTLNSSRARYTRNEKSPYYFVFVFETDTTKEKSIKNEMDGLAKKIRLASTTYFTLLDNRYTLAYIQPIASKSSAQIIKKLFEEQRVSEKIKSKGKSYNFVISEENFEWFYQTKELDTYLEFYSKNYQLL